MKFARIAAAALGLAAFAAAPSFAGGGCSGMESAAETKPPVAPTLGS